MIIDEPGTVVRTCATYRFAVETDAFIACEMAGDSEAGNVLHDQLLAETPVIQVEYHGLTGAYVFYTLNEEYDNPETHFNVKTIIDEFIFENA